MATNAQPMSDLAIPPGDYLLEVVHEAGITQADLARKMGRPAQAINEIIKGEKAITADTALQLEQVIGVPAHVWTGLEAEYQLVRARQQAVEQELEEVVLLKGQSYPELALFADLPPAQSAVDKVRQLRRFLGLASLHNLDGVNALRPAYRQLQRIAHRRGSVGKSSLLPLAVWLRRAEREAERTDVATFDQHKLLRCAGVFRSMILQPPDELQPSLTALLAGCGVVFLAQPYLPKAGVYGATFWMGPDKAVLVTAHRYQEADEIWYSVLHGIGHLALHGKNRTYLESAAIDPDSRHKEQDADHFARIHLIPPDYTPKPWERARY
jgi:HTH-type transcriptional regulator / antitoxin HigA